MIARAISAGTDLARRFARRRRVRSTGGFLLLEALVAVGIMAFILSVLPSGVIIARKSVQTSANVVGARLVAEAVLTNEFSGTDLTVGTNGGTLDGYEWATVVRPNEALREAFPSRQWQPFDVIVQVLVPNGPKVTLETIRLGRER
ncbi:type II secretion system protein [Microbaculum marinisediminis]|uniref:Prepilin-type N-terminal cleavage/methylation domain-containing protein n=1 Tax=Microbaculum marinisediminis TaxID=2931392 RepID=A0AAW5R808_9HYPH|nr:hypothetical protein [Microbaculum sp. A6E488]MCT8974716.1 hypothetical protein [Microbaculum sp. A6E488]